MIHDTDATQLAPDDLGSLKRLLQPVAVYWVAIADQLGMTSLVPTIRSTPENTSPPAFLRDLLNRWLNKGQPTLETLCRALREDVEVIGGAEVATKLEEVFQCQRDRVEKVRLIVDEVLPMADNSPLDEGDLFDVLEQMLPMVARWNAVGIGLGLYPSRLDSIGIEMGRSSPMECMTAVVLAWLRRQYNVERFGDPTWRTLVQVVANPAAGNNTKLALEIAREHSAQETSATTSSTPATSTSSVNKADRLSVDDLAAIQRRLYDVRYHWYNLGLEFGLRVPILDSIDANYNSDPSQCFRHVLKEWLKRVSPPPTWQAMVKALRSPTVAQYSLAEQIQAELQPTLSTQPQPSSSQPHPKSSGKSTSQCDKPTLVECMKFPGRDKTINIASEIGLCYLMFGVLLLDDHSGAKVESFALKRGNNAEQISMDILEEWIDGRGRHPVTWATLTEVLRDCNLSVLAAEIEALKVSYL